MEEVLHDHGRTGSAQGSGAVELSIVMPCLDEAETLEVCIRKAQGFLAENDVRGEVIVADNGSTDGSQEIAARLGARVVDVPVRGYGAALYYGINAAQGEYGIMGDADDSYDFAHLMPFLEALRDGNDLVMGNRFKGGVQPGAMPWKNKYIGNPILTGIGRLLFKTPVSDFHCGLRGFRLDAFRRMELCTTGMEFASEMVIKAVLKKMKIAEVPTTLSPDGRSRPPHLKPWRDGLRHLRFMLLYSPQWLFLYPGIILMIAGFLLGAWVLPEPRTVGPAVLDIHTIFYAALAVLVGFEAVSFFLLSKAFAIRERLLPRDPRLESFFETFGLRWGVILGVVFAVAGVAGLIGAIVQWSNLDFGELDVRTTMRIVIPSGLAITLGSSLILTSFFLAILRLPTQMKD